MKRDARVERKAHHIVYMIGENEHIELSDKSRHDIFETVRAVAEYWKEEYDKMHKENYAKRYNETKLWIRENPNASREDIQHIMLHVDNGVYVRDMRVKEYA